MYLEAHMDVDGSGRTCTDGADSDRRERTRRTFACNISNILMSQQRQMMIHIIREWVEKNRGENMDAFGKWTWTDVDAQDGRGRAWTDGTDVCS